MAWPLEKAHLFSCTLAACTQRDSPMQESQILFFDGHKVTRRAITRRKEIQVRKRKGRDAGRSISSTPLQRWISALEDVYQ